MHNNHSAFCERRRPLNWILIPVGHSFHSASGATVLGAERERRQNHLRHCRALSISLSEMPFARAQDSTAASPYWGDGFPHGPAGNGMSRECKQNDCRQRDEADHLPSMTLMPSHTAPTKPETIMVMTALNV